MQHRSDGHDEGDDRTGDGGDGIPLHPQGGKPEVSADQAVVQHQVDGVGSQVGLHGDHRIARAPLRRVDHQREHVERHASDDDAEIGDGRLVGVRLAAGEPDQGIGEGNAKDGDRDGEDGGEFQGEQQNPVG